MGKSLAIWVILIGQFLGVYLFLLYMGIDPGRTFSMIVLLMPIWLPVVTFFLLHEKWFEYIQYHFARKNPRVTLEIIMPQEVTKSPAAMELVFNQLHQTATIDNHVQAWWDGKHPPTFGLELVSTGGNVQLCINTPTRYRNIIESQLFAQYPGIDIRQQDIDYAAAIPTGLKGHGAFAMHFRLGKPDPYPIKTYFDYGLNMNPKEEEKVDPLTPVLETLSGIGPGEHMWVQFLIKANKDYNFKSGKLKYIPDWKDSVKKEMTNILETARKRGGKEEGGMVQMTDGEKDNMKALERSLSKYAFDVYTRSMYAASEEHFNGAQIPNIAYILKPFDDMARNKFSICWRTDTDWPWWQDMGSRNTKRWKKEEIYDYKNRRYTERTSGDKGMILTTEELSTLFHPIGQVALSPGIQRSGSARGGAPLNLPT